MARELEVKYELKDRQRYVEQLRRLGIILSDPMEQHDTIFFRRGKEFIDLPDGEPVIRIRKVENSTKVTIKKYISGIQDREEVEFDISDVAAFRNFLNMMDCIPLVSVCKTRIKGCYKGAVITVDNVEGLGDYTEIEVVSSVNEIKANLKKINVIIEELGLQDTELVNLPYDEMLFMKGKRND